MARSSIKGERALLDAHFGRRSVDPIFGTVPLKVGPPIIIDDSTLDIFIDQDLGDDFANDGFTSGSPLASLYGVDALMMRIRPAHDNFFQRVTVRFADNGNNNRYVVPYPFIGWEFRRYAIDQITLGKYNAGGSGIINLPQIVSDFPFEGLFIGGGKRRQKLTIQDILLSSPITVQRNGELDIDTGFYIAPWRENAGLYYPELDDNDVIINVEAGGDVNISNLDFFTPFMTGVGPTEVLEFGSLFSIAQGANVNFNSSWGMGSGSEAMRANDGWIRLLDGAFCNASIQNIVSAGNFLGPKYNVGDHCTLKTRNNLLSDIPGEATGLIRGRNSFVINNMQPGPYADDVAAAAAGVAIGSDYYDTSGIVRIRIT